jgi:hypothetical protein
MDSEDPQSEKLASANGSSLTTWLACAVFVILCAAFLKVVSGKYGSGTPSPSDTTAGSSSTNTSRAPVFILLGLSNFWDPSREVVLWWDEMIAEAREGTLDTGDESNIRRADYAGAATCLECHPGNHEKWWSHAHRRMNAVADAENVLGDFTGDSTIEYLGGIGRFRQQAGKYFMSLERGGNTRVYGIVRTIGSRFFQYYIGRVVSSTTPVTETQRNVDHVLPFGYWLSRHEWVPTVHVSSLDRSGDVTYDPFDTQAAVTYDSSCSDCHTTLPFGDWITRSGGGQRSTEFTPRSFQFDMGEYILGEHAELATQGKDLLAYAPEQVMRIGAAVQYLPAMTNAINLGISCEACHNGGAEHIAASTKTASTKLPSFFPISPLIATAAKSADQLRARDSGNLNFVCGRCHSGGRPEFANGTHTWNSTEFSDGIRGFCYKPKSAGHGNLQPLTCVHCHEPHEGIGKKWKLTPAQNDRKCLDCHSQFESAVALTAHTHHAADSAGSRCMNCHMPKINEGLEDMVRTHRIFNPTDPQMIEANQPNACNLCHTDKPIDWTIGKLQQWYGAEHRYSASALAANYSPGESVGAGWLKSSHAPTRLSAASAIAQGPEVEAMTAELLRLLVGDESLLNRQFIQKLLEDRYQTNFRDQGYRFYHEEPARRAAIRKVETALGK